MASFTYMANPGRRRFLQWSVGGAAAGFAWRGARGATSGDKLPEGKMPMRKLGRTGVEVSLVGLGGYHIGQAGDEQTAVRIIRAAIDHGLTFMDNCWDYNEGRSHVWMGRALRDGYRRRAFLMTKIDGRTRKAAAAQIDQSLRDLGTDVIDLMQIHEVIRDSDPARVFGPDGAIEALVAAQKAGKIRFIGFTGHKSPAIHLKMLEAAAAHRFTFDTVQMPLNVMDAHYDSFERRVLPVTDKSGVAVLAMKPLGSGMFLRSAAAREAAGLPDGLPPLRDGIVRVGRDHRVRVDARSRAGAGRRVRIAGDDQRRSQGGPGAHGARPPAKASGRSTRPPARSTGRPATPTGWNPPLSSARAVHCSGVDAPDRRADRLSGRLLGSLADRMPVPTPGSLAVRSPKISCRAAASRSAARPVRA